MDSKQVLTQAPMSRNYAELESLAASCLGIILMISVLVVGQGVAKMS